jgi:hypothetical protein
MLHARESPAAGPAGSATLATCCSPAGSRAAARRDGRAMESSVSPCATMNGGPPSQLQFSGRRGPARIGEVLIRAGTLARRRLIGADAGAAARRSAAEARGLTLCAGRLAPGAVLDGAGHCRWSLRFARPLLPPQSGRKSLLQPARPAARAAIRARRDTARARDGSTKLDMGTLTRYATDERVKHSPVNRALSLMAAQP